MPLRAVVLKLHPFAGSPRLRRVLFRDKKNQNPPASPTDVPAESRGMSGNSFISAVSYYLFVGFRKIPSTDLITPKSVVFGLEHKRIELANNWKAPR